MTEEAFRVISVELEGRDLIQLHNEIDNLMTGSLKCCGGGMMLGGTFRDIDIIADSNEELDAFAQLLISKDYKVSIY
tara:strand:- start:676 stop:906 length:231 start_codon:yes stop_codon:yes gene_type:complete